MPPKAIIIGAGPAGLTAAYELLQRTDIVPVILEKSGDIGGISKTVNYKGNRIDIGGHRFFSKSDRVMNWWLNIMPIESLSAKDVTVTYQHKKKKLRTGDVFPRPSESEASDKVLLVRNRLSRIYFLRKFFAYPISLSIDTLKKLGISRTLAILLSYAHARIFLRKPEKNLEDFFINRFGQKLYRLFFKDYTEKVWGVSCTEISAEWGAQRIKGISIGKALVHAARSIRPKKPTNEISQKDTETSLIERFLYPKFGPGQLWEEVARQISEKGGTVLLHHEVKNIVTKGDKVVSVETFNSQTGESSFHEGDHFFSTMPVQELISEMGAVVPETVQEVANGLQYRDFITVGILLNKMTIPDAKGTMSGQNVLPDTWIYIQEKDVKVGRLQIFNNWSPFMVKDPKTAWIGLEYFCNKTDSLWLRSDDEIRSLAITELEKMGLARIDDVLDSTVLRMEKTYPAYFGTYDRFSEVRQFVDKFGNLFLVGRNGMHKYNNSDHSMLTAMTAVDNIIAGITEKANIWAINTEQEYHEEKSPAGNQEHLKSSNINATKHQPFEVKTEINYASSIKTFLLESKTNKLYIWFSLLAAILQFSIFKFWYPFPNFIHDDSFIYIDMASRNKDIDTFPIGYPRFLRLFSVFTNSDIALVAFQYLLLQASALFLLLTIFHFYKPAKTIQWILLGFIVLNPLSLHLANLVSSDALFLALSFIWFSLLLWIINRPSTIVIVLHALVLFYVFTVRYNALIYPIISLLAFGLSPLTIRRKLLGMGLSIFCCLSFILYTGNKYKQLTGSWQFSPFSGWQLAANAMIAYRYVDSVDRETVPKEFRKLDNLIRVYYSTTKDVNKYHLEEVTASTFNMWMPGRPLQQYMIWRFSKDTNFDKQRKWASMGPLYTSYGSYLIKTYPLHFIKYFLWPNASHYYAPPIEFLERYNEDKDNIDSSAQSWFGYRTTKVEVRFEDSKAYSLLIYPILSGVMNVLYLCGLLCFLMLNGPREKSSFPKLVTLSAAIWLLNAGFTIFASPAALRFQSFSVFLTSIFGFLILNWMVKMTAKDMKRGIENATPSISDRVYSA